MSTIKLYKITCTRAFQATEQGTRYSLRPWGNDTPYYGGYDDGGMYYDLPEGYTVETMPDGSTGIFDNMGKYCDIFASKGGPELMSTTRSVVLTLTR